MSAKMHTTKKISLQHGAKASGKPMTGTTGSNQGQSAKSIGKGGAKGGNGIGPQSGLMKRGGKGC